MPESFYSATLMVPVLFLCRLEGRMIVFYRYCVWLFLLVFCICNACNADVVKPALVEITAKNGGEINIEIRTSIEAMLTGINAKYKNTQEAPQAEAYDRLRVMQAEELAAEFEPFKPRLLEQIALQADKQPVPLAIASVDIPEPGYTKVPRPALIVLQGKVDAGATELQWYYPAEFGDNAVRVRQVDEAKEKWHWSDWQWLRNDQPSEAFSLTEVFRQQSVIEVMADYIVIGFEHIFPKGLDHILFILGVFLFSVRLKPLFWQVTMFTIAHTITLGLSMNGVISLPTNIVEPLIALSIAYIGVENIFSKQQLHNSRLLLVFGFGLLHGLGFASVLADFGMPEEAFAIALIAFNVGVEFGQLAIILVGYILLSRWFGEKAWYRSLVVIPGSLVIAGIGLYWTFERLEWL
ncbi:MAG: HupE/UreJ family protein [Thiolinea sp.]